MFLLVIFGFLAGIVGGMGMGGGTVLVPLLSFLDLSQQTVQAINLISFLPMCCAALLLHSKNHLVKTQNILWVVLPACVGAVAGAFGAGAAKDKLLTRCFAIFLMAVGLWQLIVSVRFALKQRKQQKVLFSAVRCLKGKNSPPYN